MDVAIENIGCSKNSNGGSKEIDALVPPKKHSSKIIDWFQQKPNMVVAKLYTGCTKKQMTRQQKLGLVPSKNKHGGSKILH